MASYDRYLYTLDNGTARIPRCTSFSVTSFLFTPDRFQPPTHFSGERQHTEWCLRFHVISQKGKVGNSTRLRSTWRSLGCLEPKGAPASNSIGCKLRRSDRQFCGYDSIYRFIEKNKHVFSLMALRLPFL